MYDKVTIYVYSGSGGNGIVSFRKEKFVPFGGPDGGDGGDGGDVIVRANADIDDLRWFIRKRHFRAENGQSGMGSKRHGKRGKELVIEVPAGTVVWEKTADDESNGLKALADLDHKGDEVVVARGGKGGLGNPHFMSSTNQAPQLAQAGARGEEKTIVLELKLIADVGIIGYPNAGKSTLLKAASAAKPEVANYPFTTKEPVLGMVDVGMERFVIAEIPGLIDGAHTGRGLGHDFLRHSERTRLLIHLVDGSEAEPAQNMLKINEELMLFDHSLAEKPQIVAVNKVDMPEVYSEVSRIREEFAAIGVEPLFISAETGDGVAALMARAQEELAAVREKEKAEAETEEPERIFRPKPRDLSQRVYREGKGFVINFPKMERILEQSDINNAEVLRQINSMLHKAGIVRDLEKAGIKPGDKVRCGNTEWRW